MGVGEGKWGGGGDKEVRVQFPLSQFSGSYAPKTYTSMQLAVHVMHHFASLGAQSDAVIPSLLLQPPSRPTTAAASVPAPINFAAFAETIPSTPVQASALARFVHM